MMNLPLHRIQSEFQNYVLGASKEHSAVAALINDKTGLPADRRLAIYYDAYRIRLAEALSDSFPKTHAYIGDDAFAKLCNSYIREHPSFFSNVHWFGDKFAAFAAKMLPDQPIVAELAVFERALGSAYDAADGPILSVDQVSQLSESDRRRIGFLFQPSHQLLTFHWNAPAIWWALKNGEPPPPATFYDVSCTWQIWRKNLQSHFRYPDKYEAIALRGLAQGLRFSTACANAADASDTDITKQIAGWLPHWLAESILADINWACIG